MTEPLERRDQAEELFIIDGLTLEQTSEQTGISVQTLKQWSTKDGWKNKRKDYRRDRETFRGTMSTLRTKMLTQALETLDPQVIYALVALEKVLMSKGKGDAGKDTDGAESETPMTKEELMKILKDKMYGL